MVLQSLRSCLTSSFVFGWYVSMKSGEIKRVSHCNFSFIRKRSILKDNGTSLWNFDKAVLIRLRTVLATLNFELPLQVVCAEISYLILVM